MRAMYGRARELMVEFLGPVLTEKPRGARSMAAHISLDIWSSRALQSYMAILLHYHGREFPLGGALPPYLRVLRKASHG